MQFFFLSSSLWVAHGSLGVQKQNKSIRQRVWEKSAFIKFQMSPGLSFSILKHI